MQHKSNIIKILVTVLAITLLTFMISACGNFVSLTPLPSKAIFITEDSETSALYQNILAYTAAKKEYSISAQKLLPDNILATVTDAVKNGALAAIFESTSATDSENAIIAAKQFNLPLIITGEKPADEAMDSYDKVWYLSASPKNGGEQLGTVIGDLFKAGKIPDINGDGILQLSIADITSDSALKSVVLRCADLGVFSQDETMFEPLLSEGESYTAMLNAFNAGVNIEAIIAHPAFNALAGVNAALNTDKIVPVFAIGSAFELTNIDKETPLTAYAIYPDEEIAQAVNSFLLNIFKGEDVTNSTNFSLNQHKVLMFPYRLVQKQLNGEM